MSTATIREILFDEAEEFAPTDLTEPNYTNYINKIDRKIDRTKSQVPDYLSSADYDLAVALLVANDLLEVKLSSSDNSGKIKSYKLGDEQITYSEDSSNKKNIYITRYERILERYPQIGGAYVLEDIF